MTTTMKNKYTNLSAILHIILLGHFHCKLLVPDLSANEYVIAGDIKLGVLMRILRGTSDGRHCDPATDTIYHEFLQMCEAVVYATQQINRNPNLLPNVTLGLVCADYCTSPITALARSLYMVPDHPQCPVRLNNASYEQCVDNKTSELEHRKVVGVIGPGYSRMAITVSSLFTLFQIPLLGTYASSDELSDKTQHEFFMRLVAPDRFQAQAFVDLILYFNWTYIGLLYSEGGYGEHGAKRIRDEVTRNDLCLAFDMKLATEKCTSEIDSVFDLLDEYSMSKVVVWFVEDDVMERYLQAFEERNRLPNHIMLLSDSAGNAAPKYALASRGAITIGYVLKDIPGFKQYITNLIPGINTENHWLKQAWQEEFNCDWNANSSYNCLRYKPEIDWYGNLKLGSLLYEGCYLFAYALHSVINAKCPKVFNGEPIPYDCIKGIELLQEMKNSNVDMLGTPMIFDRNGDRLATYQLYHYVIDNDGQQRKLEVAEWDKSTSNLIIDIEKLNWLHLNPDEGIEENFTDFHNVFIPFSICSKECDPKQFKIQRTPHCCWDCKWCRDNEILANNKTSCSACPTFTWPDPETNEVCHHISPDYIKWNDSIAISFSILAVIGAVVTLAFTIIFYRNRGTKLVKSTNKELSFTILLGAFFAFWMVLSFFTKPTIAVCYIRDIGFHAVVTLLYAPLMVKTLRIYFIFSSGSKGKRTPGFVSTKGQRIIAMAAIFIQMVIIVVVRTWSPSNTELLMPVLTEPYVELTCTQEILPFIIPLLYNVIFIVVCGFLGYGARKLPENFNESGFIFVSVSTTFFAWVVFLPTYFTAYSTKHQAMILALCLLLNGYITICCLYASKIYALYFVDEGKMTFSTMTTQVSVTESSHKESLVTTINVQPVNPINAPR